MSSDNKSSENGSSSVSIILLIISAVCYANINDDEAKRCSVTEQKNYLFNMWIFQSVLLGIGLLSCCVLCCTLAKNNRTDIESNVGMCGYILYALNAVGFLVITCILWSVDPYVYQFKLHDCINGTGIDEGRSTIVTAIQIIPMIYTIIAWIMMAVFAVLFCAGFCIWIGSFSNEKRASRDIEGGTV